MTFFCRSFKNEKLKLEGLVEKGKSIHLRKVLRGDNFQIGEKVLSQRYDSSAHHQQSGDSSGSDCYSPPVPARCSQVLHLKFAIDNMTFLPIILVSCSGNLSFKSISSDLCF